MKSSCLSYETSCPEVTKFTLEKDQSLATYIGMKGEANRKKLADLFKRPIAFKEYCGLSASRCSESDNVASRPPNSDGSEDEKYFIEGVYWGHFLDTDENDCEKNPACTGHFADLPCGWQSYFHNQKQHFDIALKAGGGQAGYSYSELVEIWSAAAVTKSDLIGMWFTPQSTQTRLRGTDAEMMPVRVVHTTTALFGYSCCISSNWYFSQVSFPGATEDDCKDNRVHSGNGCGFTDAEIEASEFNNGGGTCGNGAVKLMKTAALNLQNEKRLDGNTVTVEQLSPAYDVYKDFHISEQQIDSILLAWEEGGRGGFGLRLATCAWVADNLDDIIHKFIPDDHPQVFSHPHQMSPDAVAALAIGILSVVLVIFTLGYIFEKHKRVRRSAQIEFLALLLVGLLMVSTGSFLLPLQELLMLKTGHCSGICTASMWMIIVGFTLVFVPLLVRVSAIIKLVRAARKLRRVKVDKRQLIAKSLGVSALAIVYCSGE